VTRRSPIYNFAAQLDRECREAYSAYLAAWEAQAIEATRGALVTQTARELGITFEQLLSGPGHHMKFRAYATRELHDFAESNPLKTRQVFERQWLDSHHVSAVPIGA